VELCAQFQDKIDSLGLFQSERGLWLNFTRTIPPASSTRTLIIRNSCSATQPFPPRCGNGINFQKIHLKRLSKNCSRPPPQKSSPKPFPQLISKNNSPQKIPKKLSPLRCGNAPAPQKKSSPGPFPPRCRNGINFPKNPPQNSPKKLFPLRCRNAPAPLKIFPKTVPAALRERKNSPQRIPKV
jgi:hypothetical protein